MTRPLVAVVAAVALAPPFAGPVGAAAAGDEPTALVVFVSIPANLFELPDATALRRAAGRELAAALAEQGRSVVTAPELEPAMRTWRVRSERDVGPGFLGALGNLHGAREVVLATVAVYRDRVQFAARGLSPNSGRLGWVHSVEERRASRPAADLDAKDPGSGPQAELERVVAAAARRLAAGCTTRGVREGAEELVVLPLRPVGVDRGPAGLVVHCFLRSLLDTGRWTIPDPTAVVAALQEAGQDPLLLDPASRRVLADRFGARLLVVPRLVAFPPGAADAAAAAPGRDDFGGANGASLPESSFLLSLVAVDTESGRILAGETTYLAPRNPAGMFGIARQDPLDARIQGETDRLVHALLDGGRDPE